MPQPVTISTAKALDAFIKLKRSAENVSTRAHTVLAKYDLTESQFGILEAINHLGPLCQKDLSRKILRTTANITLTIDRLENKGLVIRQRDLADRRYCSIHLTETGQQLISNVFPKVKDGIVRAMSALCEEDLKELARMCKTLGLSPG
jgi:MarR family 2-MHQ and catechol resistance regulon transcriptional repressor